MSVYALDEGATTAALSAADLEALDPSLDARRAGSLEHVFPTKAADLEATFFARYAMGYLPRYCRERGLALRVVTHPRRTSTCFEKAEALGAWDALDVIKCLYFEHVELGHLYAIVIPETGCFVDRDRVAAALGVASASLVRKAQRLPRNMEPGTCSPFVTPDDLRAHGGLVERIVFDTETLVAKKHDGSLDDFSFGLDHRMSLQMGYYHAFRLLKGLYPEAVRDEEILSLSFSEVLVRTKGRLKISYEFKSLNYRIARFINGIHGSGDVSIVNDHVDELDLPDVLTSPQSAR